MPGARRDAPVERGRRKARVLAVKLAVSGTLLVVLLSTLELGRVWDLFASSDAGMLAAGGLLVLGQTAISTLKWQLLLGRPGAEIPYLSLLKTYYGAGFLNLFLPGGVLGGDAYRTAWLGQRVGGLGAALPSVALDRVTGVIALGCIALYGAAGLVEPGLALPLVAGVLVLTAAAWAIAAGPVLRRLEARPPRRLARIAPVVADILRGLRPSRVVAAVLALSFLFQLNIVVVNAFYAAAIGLDVGFGLLLAIVPLVYLLETLPISINGIGLREGAFAAIFAQMGLPAEQGFALGLTVTLMRYAVGSLGGVLLAHDWLFGHMPRPRTD